MSTDILNKKKGESDNREMSAVNKMRFGEHLTPFLNALPNRTSSPKKIRNKEKKLTPVERLRRYIELKYGKIK